MVSVVLAEGCFAVFVRADHDCACRRHLHHSGNETYRGEHRDKKVRYNVVRRRPELSTLSMRTQSTPFVTPSSLPKEYFENVDF